MGSEGLELNPEKFYKEGAVTILANPETLDVAKKDNIQT